MSSLFDFDKPADAYAVMGNPITHSKSPQIHAAFAAQTGQRVVYSATQVDPGGFEQAVGNFFAHNGKGLNITVPFKREAWALAGELGPEAKLAGAVNTLLMDKDGVLVGYWQWLVVIVINVVNLIELCRPDGKSVQLSSRLSMRQLWSLIILQLV